MHNHPYFDQLAREGDPQAAVVQKISLTALSECSSGTPDEALAKAIELAEKRNRRYEQLRSAFEEGIIPAEETRACVLWLTAAEIAEFLPGQPGKTGMGGVFYATTSWQDKVWELDPEHYNPADVMQFRIPYAELQSQQADSDTYAAVNDRWISHALDDGAPTEMEARQLLSVQNSPWLGNILACAGTNPQVAAALGKIIKGAIHYGQLSGLSLDFMGENNAVVTREGQARLPDVLMVPERPMLRQLPAVLGKIAVPEGLTQQEVSTLLNTVGHVRTMNFLAAWLDLPDRLDLGVDMSPLKPDGWKMIQRILTASTWGKDLRAATGSY